MIELMVATYGVLLWLVFKKFKLLPINTWTMVGAFLVGAFVMGFLLIMMNMYQPISKDSRYLAPTTPIISEVRGLVVDVPVSPNQPLKKGDVLFQIDPEPFRERVASLDAQLTLASTRLQQESEAYKVDLKSTAGPAAK